MKIIDFHAHILPKADHGSDSVETSLAQIELSKSAGIDVIVATPHFYPHKHSLEKFLERRNSAFDVLMQNTDANILCGAEILLCDYFENLDGIDRLCIDGTKTLLIELPFSHYKDSYTNSVEKLIDRGYDVIIAHADRYAKENIYKLIDVGAKIQLNVSSLSGLFVKKHIKAWLDLEDAVAIGSDIHMLNRESYKKFNKAKVKLKDKLNFIMEESAKYAGISDFIK